MTLEGRAEGCERGTASAAAATIAAALVAVLALALRRWGWENWSFWLDECLQLFVSSHSTADILALLANERNHPPLFYLMVHAALRVSASALFLRWLPAVLSALAVLVAFHRAGGARQPWRAVGTALTLAVLPLSVHLGQELRAYALAILLVALADLARLRHDETGHRAPLIVFCAASIAAVYSLYLAFFPLAAFWLGDALEAREPSGENARRRLRIVPVVTILAFLPWLLSVRSNLARPNEIPAPPLTAKLVAEFATGFVADRQPETRFWPAAAVVWGLAALGAVAPSRERRRALLELLVILGGVGLFLRLTNHWYELRYFSFAMWPLARLAGQGLGAVDRFPRRLRAPAFLAAAALFVGVEWRGLAENARTGRVDWRDPVDYLVFQRREGLAGPIVPVDWWSYMTLYAHDIQRGRLGELREPALSAEDLARALGTAREGWIVRANWGGSQSAMSLDFARPWGSFERADAVRIYRFESARVLDP